MKAVQTDTQGLKTDAAHVNAPSGWFPWDFFLAIFALSAPLWLLASLYETQLLPGLPISALMFLTCPLVAYAFTWRSSGWLGAKNLLVKTFDVRKIATWFWGVMSFLLMPCVLLATYIVMRMSGMPLPSAEIAWLEAPLLFGLFFIAAAGEELAWSGAVLDPLQSRWGMLPAALVIGLVTAIWHIIPYAQAGNSVAWIVGQCLFTLVFRIVIVAVYNLAGRSVFSTIVLHASYNVAWQLFPNRGSGYDPWVATAVTLVVALTLVFRAQRKVAVEKS